MAGGWTMRYGRAGVALAAMIWATSAASAAWDAQASGGDIPRHFKPVHAAYDYDQRDVMIAMRDG